MSTSTFRWGILGAAQIARKNWKAIRNAGGTVVAVASRDPARSAQFVAECQADAPMESVPRTCGYEELLAAADVDGVYIPLPTGLRKEWVLRAARAGKHILCEKPCAPTVADLREMLAVCREHGVQFMDGVMFMHSRRLERIREVLSEPKNIGEIRRITSAFTFLGQEDFLTGNIRMRSDLEPHGCVGDLGWYCIRFALWTMNWQMPVVVTGRILHEHAGAGSPAPVPVDFSGELFFDGGTSAGFYCSFIAAMQQWATISGSSGYLTVPDFVLPFYGTEVAFDVQNTVFSARGCDFNVEPHWRRYGVHEYSNSHPTAQESNLFRVFAEQAASGRSDAGWGEQSLKTQILVEACLRSARAGSKPVEIEIESERG